MPQTYTNLLNHVVFATKERQPFLTDELRSRVCSYIGGILRQEQCILMAGDGVADHLHLLIKVHPTKALSDLMRIVKTNSSRWISDECGVRGFAWQDGFGAFSVSHSLVDQVCEYIRRQREHHAERAFLDELRALYDKHGIEYDPRWLA
jgi:REP element-mobilizing transposase RayT